MRRSGSGSGSGGVDDVTGIDGIIVDPTTGHVVVGQDIVAAWPLGIPRIYAVSSSTGNNANLGYADPVTASPTDYAAACVAAGAVAKATLAGLGEIFPRNGGGRKVVILIEAGTYADGLDSFLDGVVGYEDGMPLVRGTITDGASGSVAFAGDATDALIAGCVNGTGLNAAGYDITGSPTAHSFTVEIPGGGAPGWGAEPARPQGLRSRFNPSNPTLPNTCNDVAFISGNDTAHLQSDMAGGAPLVGDRVYFEQGGVVVAASNFSATPNGVRGIQLVGIRVNGALAVQNTRLSLCVSGGTSLTATDAEISSAMTYTDPVLGSILSGGGFRAETTATFNSSRTSLAGLCSVTSTLFTKSLAILWGIACSAARVSVQGAHLDSRQDLTADPCIGTIGGTGVGIPRIFGGAGTANLILDGCAVTVGDVSITGAGGTPGIQFKGAGLCNLNGQPTGSTGNTDVGADFQNATAFTLIVKNGSLPTVTGTAGDIRLGGQGIQPWTNLNFQEMWDTSGNHLRNESSNGPYNTAISPAVNYGVNNSGVLVMPFSMVQCTGGASNQYKAGRASRVTTITRIMGVLLTDGSNGEAGIIATDGPTIVRFNSTPVKGATAYLSDDGDGTLTTTAPSTAIPVGVVLDTGFAGNLATVALRLPAGGEAVLTAAWPLTTLRVYAVDTVNGDDGNVGYADPASTSAGDYALACIAAGAAAKKTIAGLTAIFPKFGAGRMVEVVIANGGVNTQGSYAETLGQLLNGVNGYAQACPVIRGTGTNTTAGCVAFDGSAADSVYQGAITVTGLNVAGYNPVGATTSSLPCQLAGGGAAALPAEPAAPLGWRVRFDANTTTVGLRNQCRQIAQVSGGNTIVPQTAFSNAPANGDVFYIEQPGVAITVADVITGCAYGSPDNTTLGFFGFQVSAIRWSSTLIMSFVESRMAFVGQSSLNITGDSDFWSVGQTIGHPVLGSLSVGGGVRTEALSGQISTSAASARAAMTGVVNASSTFAINACSAVTWGQGSYVGAALTWQNCTLPVGASSTTSSAHLGVTTAVLRTPRATRLIANNVCGSIGACNFEGAGANPAIKINNRCFLSFIALPITGVTGNNDVGLDLTGSFGSTIMIFATPTVTGALGDVRLAGGQIVTWAQLIATGIVDSQGNRIISNSAQPLATIKFTGALFGGVGAVLSYCADTSPTLLLVNEVVATRYPISQRLLTRLRVTVLALSTNTINNTVTLYKNGVATTMTITIPAGTAAFTKFADAAHPIIFADGDDFTLRLDNAGADVAAVTKIAAVLEHPV